MFLNTVYIKIKKNKKQKKQGKCKNRFYIVPDSYKKTYLTASATLEASLVMPIYIYAVMTIAFMLQIINIKSTVMQQLYNTAREVSRYAYSVNCVSQNLETSRFNIVGVNASEINSAAFYTYAKGKMLLGFTDNFNNNCRIVGKTAGISLLGSEFAQDGSDIYLVATYVIKNPYDIFGVSYHKITQRVCCTAWLGEDKLISDNSDKDNMSVDDTTVYITENGEVYHTNRNCSYISPTINNAFRENISDLRNESGGKYYECELCGKNNLSQYVYTTPYGDRYHSDINCSALKRTVIEVPLSSVSERRCCSKCDMKN